MAKTKTLSASPELLQQNLHRSGRRLTSQRMIVFEALRTLKGHSTADRVYQAVLPKLPTITRATVYRNLEVLRDEGLVTGTDLGQGSTLFEVSDDHRHHHLVCLHCGHIQEIPDQLFNSLAEGIQNKYKFQLRMEHFAIFGLCKHCAN